MTQSFQGKDLTGPRKKRKKAWEQGKKKGEEKEELIPLGKEKEENRKKLTRRKT